MNKRCNHGEAFSNGDELWAPPGGENKSFREMVGDVFILKSGITFPTTQQKMYLQVREYRDKYPDKAILSTFNDISPIPSLMAGAAQVLTRYKANSHVGHMSLFTFVNTYLADILMHLSPKDNLLDNESENWCMLDEESNTMLIYSLSGEQIMVTSDISEKQFAGVWYDPLTERTIPVEDTFQLKKGAVIKKPTNFNWLLLLKAK